MKKKWFWLAVGAVVVLGGGFLLLNNGRNDKITYRTAKADRGDIAVLISATGTLQAVTTVEVGSQVSGTIAKLYADFNTRVKKGQLLAQLDPTFLQATVNEQRANVDRATAQVNEAQRNFNRTSDLFTKSLVSQADMDAATTALESAKASLAQAKAALDRAVVNLRYATIKAPISGVVISRDVDVGQTVAASLQAPKLFTIAQDLRKMQVQASVDEADIGNVKAGQAVTFRVDAYPDLTFKGIVSQIRLAPVITQNVVTYTVIIDVDNNDLKLMPGMTATVSIEVASKEDVLRVPIQAVRFTPPADVLETLAADTSSGERRRAFQRRQEAEGQEAMQSRMMRRSEERARIWVLKDGKPIPRFIRRGLQNATHVEVVRGDVNEGDEVIIGVSGGTQTSVASGQTNPFAPRFPTGGGRRGGF